MAKTAKDLLNEADALDEKAKALRNQASDIRHAELLARPLFDRLIFAAYARCTCGYGMAYDPASEGHDSSPFKGPSKWECAGVLLGTGDKKVLHTAPLPFAFYEVKSENQPSANGATTCEFEAPG